jgi:enoyl-CoA hydratase/carnithine racemase
VPVHLERPADHPHVAVVTLDRPEKANALDPAMLSALAAAWREIAADDEVRCALLTGAGERVFCAGMDMSATIGAAQALARGERIDDARPSRASTWRRPWCAPSTAMPAPGAST